MSALRELANILSASFKWWFIVAPWEQALRVRGGKTARCLAAGVHFKVPFWDRIYRQAVRLRVVSASPQTLETADGKVVAIQLLIEFRVDDMLAMYTHLHSPTDTLSGLATGAASKHVQATPANALSPDTIANAVRDQLATRVRGFGLADFNISVVNFVYAPRAYRLITGGLESDIWGGNMSMSHDEDNG